MTYGNRLNQALTLAGKSRLQLAEKLGCAVQSIGLVINSVGHSDRKLSLDNHAAAVAFLKVNEKWLRTGEGSPEPTVPNPSGSGFSLLAESVAALLDLLPADQILRAEAHSRCEQVLRELRQRSALPNEKQIQSLR